MIGSSTNKVGLTVIIPILNEEKTLPSFIDLLVKHSCFNNQFIFVDGGSTDKSCKIIYSHPHCQLVNSEKGRAKQMNVGAKYAQFPILYFLHVDSLPPKNYDQFIINHVHLGFKAGSFRLQFDTQHFLLNFFTYLTRFNFKICRGGDQSLFVHENLFSILDGYNEDYLICEDNEFIDRIYDHTTFTILPYQIVTSARRFKENGVIKLYFHHGIIQLMRLLGFSPQSLTKYYKSFVR